MRVFFRAASAALALALTVTGSAVAQSAASSTFKIAYVNTDALLDAAPGRAEAEATFQKEVAALQARTKSMEDSLNNMLTDYAKSQATMTAAAKDARQKAIQAKQQEFQQRAAQYEQQAGDRQNALMQPIMETVRRALEQVRQEDGYAMILAANPNLILASDKNLDITDRVVARLRTMAATQPKPATGAPAAAPSGVTRPKP